MIVKSSTEKEYIEKYLKALQGLTGMSDREIAVAASMALRYVQFTRIKETFKTQAGKDSYDPMTELKKKEALNEITKELNMSFPVFRNYVSALKRKGFFKGGDINPACLPKGNSTTITFVLDDGSEPILLSK
tara:strand:+ start:27763 stop:28158 length:396 start_codon:yes stop_codon:yes gene_type:complete